MQEWQPMQLHDWELLLMRGCSCWFWWKDDEDVQKDRPTYAIVGMFGMNPIQWANISNFVTGAAASRNIQFCNRLHSLDTFGSLSILQWNWTVTLIDTHEHTLYFRSHNLKSSYHRYQEKVLPCEAIVWSSHPEWLCLYWVWGHRTDRKIQPTGTHFFGGMYADQRLPVSQSWSSRQRHSTAISIPDP